MTAIGAILLAAGNSSRMGSNSPKQLLDYRGQPLLVCAAQTVLAANLSPLVIVLGANAQQIRPTVETLPVHIVENPNWPAGMSTSLRAGLAKLLELTPSIDALIVMLCDQPLLRPEDLAALITAHTHTQKPLTAAVYNNTVGVPALVSKKYFQKLARLPDNAGAKSLFTQHPEDLATVPLPNAALDIDTPADYSQVQRS